jgi:hypothetical protein
MADKQFSFTLFPDQFAKSFEPIQATLEEMAHNIELPCAASKAELPWLKMAIMGDKPSEKGCYRTNENVAALTGIEADYDSGAMSFDEAALWLDAARLTALLYTTPSYTDEKPRWRVLCPFSGRARGETGKLQVFRDTMLSRLNAVLDGGLARESWTLSQAYYFGNVEGGVPVRVCVLHGDYINLRDDLPVIGKPGSTPTTSKSAAHSREAEPITEAQMMDMARAAAYACRGMHYPDLLTVIFAVARTPIIGRDDDAVQREAVALICEHNEASESVTEGKINDAFAAAMPGSGSAVTPATFYHYAKLGGWRPPLGATYSVSPIANPWHSLGAGL